ncbi:hypothetical protein [Proteus terrae]|uniref:hypothetical protein n=1 Tax=Proteus terrae TaxID=1574161 RepID=UPI0018C62E16|nr:hypothetical protein [Proteus mirabilis]
MDIDLITKVNPKKITHTIRQDLYKLGLGDKLISKCSEFLIMQLDYIIRNNLENVSKVIHELNNLESGNSNSSRTKPAKQFCRPPLKGLYHKHYEGTGLESLKFNINNQLISNQKKHNTMVPEFQNWLFEYVKNNKGNKEYFDEEDCLNISNEFAKQLINDSFNQKTRNKTITGHWIIYAKHNNDNYYLAISRHTKTKEDELIIRKKIEETCIKQFPFLKNIIFG